MVSNNRVLPFSSAQPDDDLARDIPWDSAFVSLLGPSAAMEHVRSQIRRVAPHFRAALLTGEPGTGADDVARALHRHSPFRSAPLKVLTARDAEFRFARSATGTIEIAPGMFYLPEIEQLSPPAQEGLLQVMRARGPRAGCVVAFAAYDLRSLVSAGSFCAELGSLLGSLRIALPAVRERREDVPALLRTLVAIAASRRGIAEPRLEDSFLEAAAAFDWSQNLDQMEAVVDSLLRKDAPAKLYADHFNAACETAQCVAYGLRGPVRMVRLDQVVQEHIRAILLACNGNKLRAAEVLGISRSTLYRTLESAASTRLAPMGG